VTSMSDSKGRKYARRAARLNPDATILIIGCSVDADPHIADKLSDTIKPENLVSAGNDRKMSVAGLLGAGGDWPPGSDTWSAGIRGFKGHTRAFVKVQDGCNSFCAYCIVPYVRGRVRSRPIESIVEEARRLADGGYREIVLTGIHVGQYGQDTDGPGLAEIVERLDAITGIRRIRLSSIEAMEMTDRLTELAAGAKLCPHFHLPLQSGSDAVLARMNRRYTAGEFVAVAQKIAARIPRVSLTTDVMVGFPGETEQDYRMTETICRQVGFGRIHVFPYSDRPGTEAQGMPHKCSPQVIADRKRRLIAAADETALAYKKQFIGTRDEVLVEAERHASGGLCGYTERYVKVVFDGPDALKGDLVTVRLQKAEAGKMHGEL